MYICVWHSMRPSDDDDHIAFKYLLYTKIYQLKYKWDWSRAFSFGGKGEILLKQPFGGGCYVTLVGQVMICIYIYILYITHTAPLKKHREKRPQKHIQSKAAISQTIQNSRKIIHKLTNSNLIIISIARPPTFNSWRLLSFWEIWIFRGKLLLKTSRGKKVSCRQNPPISHEQRSKPLADIPLSPDWFIRILISWLMKYIIN